MINSVKENNRYHDRKQHIHCLVWHIMENFFESITYTGSSRQPRIYRISNFILEIQVPEI